MKTKNYIYEAWKPIKGYVGLYEVSNFGRIKNVRTGRILKPGVASHGYYTVALCKNGKSRTFLVHRLVAETYIPNPNNLPEVNHKDCNKLNNSVDNLEWCDHVYNNTYNDKNEYHEKEVYQFSLKCDFVGKHKSVSEAARKTNTDRTQILRCCHLKGWVGNGYKWAYRQKSTIQLDDAPCEFYATYCIIPD